MVRDIAGLRVSCEVDHATFARECQARFYVASVAGLLPSFVYFVDGNMGLFDAVGTLPTLVVVQMWHHSDAKAEEGRKRSAVKE